MSDPATLPDLTPLRQWFVGYCRSFRSRNPEMQRNFDLKELHTRKVCEAARLIAAGGNPRRLMLAEVAALCHDVGRFAQFRDYGTFRDSESVNHAQLSAEIVETGHIVNFLPESERASVIAAIRFHNAFEVPAGLTAEADDLLRLVRDADKVDIWRVFIEYYDAPDEDRASGAGLGFPDLPQCSPEVVATVCAGRMVRLSMLKTLNDFKLLQLSWLYDINFPETLKVIRERSLLERLAATLPKKDEVALAVTRVNDYLEGRLQGAR
jgi:hypothetical protein